MINEQQLSSFATRSGFGANGINTHRVKLSIFARLVWEVAAKATKEELENKNDNPGHQ